MPNKTMFQFFHWSYPVEYHLWQHVAADAGRLKDLGITAIWLPPAYKSAVGSDSAGYDAYDLYDLGEFDQKGSLPTRYGTKDEYLQAIKSLHDKDINVYADVVFNHKAGADETEDVMAHKVNPDNRNEIISEDYKIKAYTKFTFSGRGNTYSEFRWDKNCFSGVDWDENKKEKGVYKLLTEYGADWGELLSDEKGSFDYLMFADTEFRNPAVREELKNWTLWYLDTTGVDGFRLDAVKHIAISFFPQWLQGVRAATQKELFAVGEFAGTLEVIRKYLDYSQRSMSLFDFPLQHHFHEASVKGAEYDLRKIFEQTLTQLDAEHSVTFVDNHDTQASRQVQMEVKAWFRPHAYALILLRLEGYPCVFYPDLYGIGDQANDNAETTGDRESPCPALEKLLIARKQYAYGNQKDYFEQQGLIGWTREGNDDPVTGLAVLLSNNHDGTLEMEVGKRHAGQTFFEITGAVEGEINIGDDGKAQFPVKAGGIAAWGPKS